MLTVRDNAAARSRSNRLARHSLIGIGLAVAAVIAVLACNDLRAGKPVEILPPASVPPVAALCSEPLSHAVDGTFTPLFCSGGELNKQAWTYMAGDGTEVMRL